MEYCGGGDLSHLIRECERTGQNFPEDTIWAYFCQIVQALSHCHSTGDEGEDGAGGRVTPGGTRRSGKEREKVLHRDLKPDNGQSGIRCSRLADGGGWSPGGYPSCKGQVMGLILDRLPPFVLPCSVP